MALAGVRTASVTLSLGTNSYTGFGFTPLFVFIIYGKKGSGTDNAGRLMLGMFDGTRQSATEILADSTPNTIKTTTKPILFQEDVSGVLTTKAEGTVTLDTDGLTFTMTTADTNFQASYFAIG